MVSLGELSWLDPQWLSQPIVRWPLTGAYLAVMAMVALYGLHRYWLVWLFYRHRANVKRPGTRFDELPRVTVQLPMYNEAQVAQRIIDATCQLDYPADRLHIQVVDDSTDRSAGIAADRVKYWQGRGVDIQYVHRKVRTGYKAGALAAATPDAKGAFIAIFDADFIPPRSFLKRTIHYFADPQVGMVQTRWDHLNRYESLLTRSQAIFLDGHFVIEHVARNRSGRWINFNGTAGIWRRAAIDSAGGWQSDTLTEDVDLSYRAQLAGWRFVFLPRVTCPAELPPEINAFKAQQHRWSKGSIQVARKLLPKLLLSDASLGVKVEAFFHLTSPMMYLYITLMVLLFFPAFYVNMMPFEDGSFAGVLWGISLFGMGTASAGTFYVASQRAQHRSVIGAILQIPILMSIGIGIAINNARGVLEALFGHESAFVRTPKYNTTDTDAPQGPPKAHSRSARAPAKVLPTPSIKLWMSLIEITMGVYCLLCAYLALGAEKTIISLPFMALFASGYFYVGITSLWSQWLGSRNARQAPLPQISRSASRG